MNSINSELYPDLVELGGLVKALTHVSRQSGIDLGVVESASSNPRGHLFNAKVTSGRGLIGISLAAHKRSFAINISDAQHQWAVGDTSSLLTAVEVAESWQNGITLRELKSRFPFMEYNELAQAYEDGDPVATQWGTLLHDEVFAAHRSLTREIYANEQLRSLFPFYSMGMLRLSTDHTSRQAGEIRISPLRSGGYRVEFTVSGRETHVENMDRIAEAAVAFLDASSS